MPPGVVPIRGASRCQLRRTAMLDVRRYFWHTAGLGGVDMRQQVIRFLLALSLVVSAGSLTGNGAQANGLEGCCVCSGCGFYNGTVMGVGVADTVCAGAADESQCDGICAGEGCVMFEFENATCLDPSLSSVCQPNLSPVPTTSAFGLMALVALLLGFGAFFVRERRA